MLAKLAVRTAMALLVLFPLVPLWAAAPQAEIDNGVVRVKLYLPDTKDGFYRGTRFDWGGSHRGFAVPRPPYLWSLVRQS